MKKLSFQKIILIVVILVFLIGLFTGDISLNFESSLQNKNNSHRLFINNLNNLEDVSWELYVSPDNSWLVFYENISSIESSLKIQTYEFTKKELKSKFKELLDRWVNIKLIMENNKYQQFQNTWNKIEDYFKDYDNFEIKSDEQMHTKYVHSKINLVDSGFWIQTANLTHSSFAKNREYFFYSHDTWVLLSLNTIFEKDWNGEKILVNDIHPNLVVCNINCRDVIESILQWAEKSIIIQTQYIVDDKILKILKNKSVNDDVETRFVVSDTETSDDLLRYFGPGVARKFYEYYNHTKMILFDCELLLLWSMNLSDNSLDKNREIGILLLDKDIISKFKELFEKDWRKSKYELINK